MARILTFKDARHMHRYAETRLFRRQHTAAEGRMPQVTAFAVAEAAVVPAEAAAVAALAGAVVAVVPPAGYPYGLPGFVCI